ncbi:MAG: hypothetical protein KGM24_02315 [Elusimicrobia bacterium]|nr:hypothetical protein [Elusimicrobiota bacterium]
MANRKLAPPAPRAPFLAALLLALPAVVRAAPRAGRTELEAGVRLGLTAGPSAVAVRENDVAGTRRSYGDLGLSTAFSPSLSAARWLDARDALSVSGRWTFLRGRAPSGDPFDFNGATIAGGQDLSTSADAWTLSLRWERRLAPRGPAGWDLRGLAGLDYAHLNFVIDGGHAPVAPGSRGTETKEDFYLQELPVPVLGLEALRRLPSGATLDLRAEGSWIENWDSLRREGGLVRLSQSQVDLRARLIWNEALPGGWRPAFGGFFSLYEQDEVSGEDGNFARYESYGPELSLLRAF